MSEEENIDVARSKVELDVERHLLGTTVCLSDGTEGLVFSRGQKNESQMFLYNCHLCAVPNLPGERCLQTHISGRKHQMKLAQPSIDAKTFRAPLFQKPKIQMNIAPGEPVPPGFENEVKPMAAIQKALDKYKETALIGVEYIIELVNIGVEPSYLCVLCDKKGDPRNIIAHIVSYNHRQKFLERHFTSVMKEIGPYRYNPDTRNIIPTIFQNVCEAIEDYHGRLTPTVCESSDFFKNRNKIFTEIAHEKHFDEKHGPNFINIIDKKMIQDALKNSKNSTTSFVRNSKNRDNTRNKNDSTFGKIRDSLDSISSDSNDSFNETVNRKYRRSESRKRSRSIEDHSKKKRRSQSPAYRIIPRVQRSPPFNEEIREVHSFRTKKNIVLPTPKELSLQASAITQEKFKWEKYRCMVELAIKELDKTLKDHEKNPEKHPLYPEEWKKFWNRRYKELQAEKKDPSKYDFKPEWIIFWTKRMKEIHNDDIEVKKAEIRKKLGLPEDGIEKTDQLKEEFIVKKSGISTDKSSVIDISDDDSSLNSTSPYKRRTQSPKRSSRRKSPRRSPRRSRRRRSSSRRRRRSLSSLSDDYDFYDKKHSHAIRERDISRDKYLSPEYYHSKSKNYYVSPAPHYTYRTLESHKYPKYEPELVEDTIDDGPLTVVAVLRLLTALEEHLGSLGPKILDLLGKALALEKIKANSSDEMLLNEDNSVFFETVKEKLKGQLIAGVLEPNKIKAVKKAIKNIASIIHQVNEKVNNNAKNIDTETTKTIVKQLKTENFDRGIISSKLAAALVIQGKLDVSKDDMDKLINVFILMVKISKERNLTMKVKDILIEMGIIVDNSEGEDDIPEICVKTPEIENTEIKKTIEEDVAQNAAASLESLTDSDLQTLLQNFKHLSSEEQHHLIAHLKKLESSNPLRVEKLRKFVDITELKDNNNKNDETIDLNDNDDKKTMENYSNNENSKNKIVIEDDDNNDDDDEDYNFDDVVKAASNNLKDNKTINGTQDDNETNLSKSSLVSGKNRNITLTDTQNLIANLMGSLQKKVFTTLAKTSNQNETTHATSSIPTIVGTASTKSNNIQQNQPISNYYNQTHDKNITYQDNNEFQQANNAQFYSNDYNQMNIFQNINSNQYSNPIFGDQRYMQQQYSNAQGYGGNMMSQNPQQQPQNTAGGLLQQQQQLQTTQYHGQQQNFFNS